MARQYIGDSVYADFDGIAVILTTDNGFGPTNTIIIEPEVYGALQRYVAQLREGKADDETTSDAQTI